MKSEISKNIPYLRVLVRGKKISVDKLVYVALINPIMAIPQLYIVLYGDSTGVSLVTWATFLVIAVIWLFYGLKHRIKPIIMVQLAWIVIDTAIVAGLLLNR